MQQDAYYVSYLVAGLKQFLLAVFARWPLIKKAATP